MLKKFDIAYTNTNTHPFEHFKYLIQTFLFASRPNVEQKLKEGFTNIPQEDQFAWLRVSTRVYKTSPFNKKLRDTLYNPLSKF